MKKSLTVLATFVLVGFGGMSLAAQNCQKAAKAGPSKVEKCAENGKQKCKVACPKANEAKCPKMTACKKACKARCKANKACKKKANEKCPKGQSAASCPKAAN
jgi:hypothetical protein